MTKFQIDEAMAGSFAGDFVLSFEKRLKMDVDPFARPDLIQAFKRILEQLEIEGKYWTHPGLVKHKRARMEHYLKVKAGLPTTKRIHRRKRFAASQPNEYRDNEK